MPALPQITDVAGPWRFLRSKGDCDFGGRLVLGPSAAYVSYNVHDIVYCTGEWYTADGPGLFVKF